MGKGFYQEGKRIVKLEVLKKKILKWTDFYGQDIVTTDEIEKAKTKKELKEIIKKHIDFLYDQHLDANSHAENFIRELDLDNIY